MAATPGHSLCDLCHPGSFLATYQGTACLACQPGTYSAAYGQTTCATCPSLQVQPYTGRSTCYECNAANSYPNLDQSACVCDAGYFLPQVAGTISSLECAACSTGVDCTQPGNTAATLTCQTGYWRASNTTDTCYRCLIRTDCSGGVNSTVVGALYTSEQINEGIGCKSNRCGVLCSHCCPGYHPEAGGLCVVCPTGAVSWLSVVLIAAAVIVAIAAQIYIILKSGNNLLLQHKVDSDELESMSDDDDDSVNSDTHKSADKDDNVSSDDYVTDTDEEDSDSSSESDVDTDKPMDKNKIINTNNPELDPTNTTIMTIYGPPVPPPDFTYKLKIFMSFLQISTNITSGLELQWPTTYTNWMLFFDVFNFDFILSSAISVDCIGGYNYYSKYIMIVITPLGILVGILVLYLLPKYLECACFRHQSAQARARSKMVFWRLFLYSLFMIYPAVSSNVLRLYVCTDIDGTSWLLTDLRVQCYTSQWKTYAFASLSLVLLYPIGIPTFFFALLRMNRSQLSEDRLKVQLGFLYAGYRSETWWFEIADCIQKLTLTSILAFIPTAAQLPVGMSVAILYMILILVTNPYLRRTDDKLALLAQTEIFMLLCAGWIFYNLPVNAYNAKDDTELSVVLIMITVGFFIAFLLAAVLVLKRVIGACLTRRAAKQAKLQQQASKPMKTVDNGNITDNNPTMDETDYTNHAEFMSAYDAVDENDPSHPQYPPQESYQQQ